MFGLVSHMPRPVAVKVLRLLSNFDEYRTSVIFSLKPRPVMPFLAKVHCIKEYQSKFGLSIFVESGTFRGDMVEAVRSRFSQIYSIELDHDLHRKAAERFADDPSIHLYLGDSGHVLPEILPTISGPALFYLDAHYSGDGTARGETISPLELELEAIKKYYRHADRCVILIDDVRHCNGVIMPSLDIIIPLLRRVNPEFTILNKDDILRAGPR